MTYTGQHRGLYMEAVRVAPAIAAARARDANADVFAIYHGFIEDCRAQGLRDEIAWSILTAAMSVWVTNLFLRQANTEGRELTEVIAEAVAAAQEWVNSGAV